MRTQRAKAALAPGMHLAAAGEAERVRGAGRHAREVRARDLPQQARVRRAGPLLAQPCPACSRQSLGILCLIHCATEYRKHSAIK
jgi:hypothetical protein